MRVTTKGQVTIPHHIREKLFITPSTEVDFVEENNRIYLVKRKRKADHNKRLTNLRGIASIKMTTEEIMSLTRADN